MNIRELLSRTRLTGLMVATGLVAIAACDDQATPIDLGSNEIVQEAATSFEVSDVDAAVGDRVTLGVKVRAGDDALGGVQGYLSWDPDKLEYVGQVPEGNTITVLNQSAAGLLHVLSVNPDGMDRSGVFAFDVADADWAGSLRFEPSAVVGVSEREYRGTPGTYVTAAADLPSAAPVAQLSDVEWAEIVDPAVLAAEGPALSAGEADFYGDGDQSGGSPPINVLDVLYAANISVGNTASAECIIGTDSPDRDCVAVNVRPVNGGVGASPPPGVNTDGTRVVNVLDVLPIAQESVCTTQPCRDAIDVVGESIPNAGGGQDRTLPTDTVFIDASTESPITGTRNLSSDTLYVLTGSDFLIVGDETGAAGSLVIEAGTRIEGEDGTAIIVSRNGQLFANGTAAAPVEFTCALPASGSRFPGCWGGVFLAGNAVINDSDPGLGAAPAIPGRNPGGGGNQKVGEGGAENYGGNNDADSSGEIRYATFRYGGQELAPDNELNNLSIGACGSGTVLENIHVHAGLDDGLELFGGRCDVKNLLATANDDDQFDYSFGYDGDVQFIVVQTLGQSDKVLEVDNTEALANYNNQPRTGPRVYNVTAIGEDVADPVGGGVRYRRGAGGELRNFLMIGFDDGFDPEELATCELIEPFTDFDGDGTTEGTGTLPNVLSFDNSVFLNVDDAGDSGGDSGECEAHVESYLNTVATDIGGGDDLTNSDAGREYAGELKAPFDPLLPDFRPVGNGVTSTAASPATPPAGFDPATYFGGVTPVGAGGAIPFYLGWTDGWQSASVR